MKIITKKGALKISKDLAKNIALTFKAKGITLKQKDLIHIENNFLKALGGKKNERKN